MRKEIVLEWTNVRMETKGRQKVNWDIGGNANAIWDVDSFKHSCIAMRQRELISISLFMWRHWC